MILTDSQKNWINQQLSGLELTPEQKTWRYIATQQRVTGHKKFVETPCGGDIVSMCTHKGMLIVATARSVYQVDDKGVLTAILFEEQNR